MMVRHTAIGLFTAALTASAASAATTLYDFDAPNQFTDHFANRGNGPSNYGGASNGGLSGGGSVIALVSDSNSTQVDQTDVLDLSVQGRATNVGAYFKAVSGPANGSGPDVTFQIGLLANGGSNGYFTGLVDSLSARVTTAGVLEFSANSFSNSFTPGGPASTRNVSLTSGSWYYLSFGLIPRANGQLDVGAGLFTASADGTIGTTVGDISDVYTESPSGFGRLYGSTVAAAGFRGAAEPRGTPPTFAAAYVDDFSIDSEVPEPTALAALAGGGLALLRRRA